MARGKTFEEREAARRERTRRNRLDHFIGAIRDARTGRQRLQQACQFAKAVGDDLDDPARTAMAREIAEIADRRNRP
jgi:hypothetical protein